MKRLNGVGLQDVQAVYSGPEGRLWELLMGEQIHIGGLRSSMDLAGKAGIQPGMRGVDLCCCTGAGMRFLLRFREVEHMHGVDATPAMIELGRQRCRNAGLAQRTEFTLAEAIRAGLPSECADFVWGEDAWCYVEDKAALIAEAVRLVKPGGIIAFTDWVEAGPGLSDAQAERFMRFMKFPTLQDLKGYPDLLVRNGCAVQTAEDTGRFAPCVDLYLNMVEMQLTYDALRIIGFDSAVMEAIGSEMRFIQQMAHEGRIAQGLFVARKL